MADPARRIENWTAKVTPERTAEQVTPQIGSIKANAAHVMNDIVQMETQVRQVLNGAGVPTIQYPFYLCFGREIWKKRRAGIDGVSLTTAAQSLHDKYVLYGLNTAHLINIADTVFGITVT